MGTYRTYQLHIQLIGLFIRMKSICVRRFVEVTPEFLDIVSRYSDHLLRIIVNTLHKMLRTGEFLASKVFGPLSVSIYLDGEHYCSIYGRGK